MKLRILILGAVISPLNGQTPAPPDINKVVLRGCELNQRSKDDGQLDAKTGTVTGQHFVWDVLPYAYYRGKKSRWNAKAPLWESEPFLKDSLADTEAFRAAGDICREWMKEMDKKVLEVRSARKRS